MKDAGVNAEVLAAAIGLVIDADRGLRDSGPPDKALAAHFPGVPRAALDDALQRARAMLRAAIDLTFAVRAEALTLEQAQRRLAADHPGFPRSGYREALSRGMFTSR